MQIQTCFVSVDKNRAEKEKKETGADLVGVDWVASHPPVEQLTKKYITWKNKRKYVGSKNIEIRGSQKPCEANQP